MSETWLKAKDVAKIIDIDTSTVLKKARCGIIPCAKVGRGIIRFSEQDIDAWMNAHKNKGALKI